LATISLCVDLWDKPTPERELFPLQALLAVLERGLSKKTEKSVGKASKKTGKNINGNRLDVTHKILYREPTKSPFPKR
jgi:hypothetical protein